MTRFEPPPLGWHGDLPDPRDFAPDHPQVADMLMRLRPLVHGRSTRGRTALPTQVDHRDFCGPVRDIRPLRMSSAAACAAMVEYFNCRATGRHVELSATFLYKVTRRLSHTVGDGGAGLRSTLKALARCGIPPAEYACPDPACYDAEPDPLLYALGRELAGLTYVRLDPPGLSRDDLLRRVRRFLAGGFAVALGFSVPTSFGAGPDIPFPTRTDGVRGGHAVLAVGYDDQRRFRSTKGALLVRNCWSDAWGDNGYGWLPYRYVQLSLAADFWTLACRKWLEAAELANPL